MKTILKTLVLCTMTLAALNACNEDSKDLSPVAIFISPLQADTVVALSGDKVRYTVELHTTHDYVQRVAVSSFDAVNGLQTLADTTFAAKRDVYYFDYTTPIVNRDSIGITLTFEAWDNTGSTCRTERYVVVKNSTHLVDEMTGIVLHAPESALPDAFALSHPSQTFCRQTSPDSLSADVCLLASPDFDLLTLASNTKAKMVRINTFDYPAATAASIQAVYQSQRRSDQIDNLRINDIILIGHGEQAEGALHITNIVRTGLPEEHCVQLAFKGISTSHK